MCVYLSASNKLSLCLQSDTGAFAIYGLSVSAGPNALAQLQVRHRLYPPSDDMYLTAPSCFAQNSRYLTKYLSVKEPDYYRVRRHIVCVHSLAYIPVTFVSPSLQPNSAGLGTTAGAPRFCNERYRWRRRHW